MGEPVQQPAGKKFRAEDPDPLVEGKLVVNRINPRS